MQVTLSQAALAGTISLNLLLLYCVWQGPGGSPPFCCPPCSIPSITILLWDFENDLAGTA